MKGNFTYQFKGFACISIIALLLSTLPFLLNSQTVLINPAAEGGFELGDGSFAANGWSLDNGTVTNQWFTGTVPAGFSNRSAFVSNDGGTSWSYTNTSTSVVHFWRDVTFPAGESIISLSFDWQALGETGSWDALLVSFAPTSYTPVASSTSLGTGTLPAPAVAVGQFWNVNSVQTANFNIPGSLIGNCSDPVTLRIIFTWKNDGSGGTPPPAAIDNISLTSQAPLTPNPLPSAGPFTIDNLAPTSGTNFNNFTDAINWLNGLGGCPVLNPIVFNVAAGQIFNEDPPEITASGSAPNTITFQKSGMGANPVIRKLSPGTIASSTGLGNNGDAIITIVGGDYITFDGIDLETDPGFSGAGFMEYGYLLKKLSGDDACKNVTIKNCNITLNKAAIYSFGVFVSNLAGTANVTVTSEGGRSENIKIFNNDITNVYGGIQLRGFAASAPYNLYDQNIEVGEDGGNTITNYAGGGSTAYGIYCIYQNNAKINNNEITGGDGTTTTHYGIFASTSQTSSYQFNNNVIDLTNNSTTSQVVGIGTSIGTVQSPTSVVEIDNNEITITRPSQTSGATYFIYNTFSRPNMWKATNNTVGNSTFPGTGIIYGIFHTATSDSALIEGNTISNITRQGTTSTSLFYGISCTGSTTTLNSVIRNNEIHSLMGMGSSGVVGGINLLNNFTANVYGNKIYNISSDNASGQVYGINLNSGVVTGNIYNNLIGDLKAPSTGNSTATNPSVRGITMASTTANSNLLVAYNTINLSATSTGTNFGTAGIFHTGNATSTTANLTLRNNIVVNNSTPNGTGRTVAFQRSLANTANYNVASNNNLFYAGTPGASNLIYADGANSDQTLNDFKCRVAPRESLSVTENPPFLSTDGSNANFLHINPAVATQVESGAVAIAGIDDDFDGDVRQGSAGYAGTGTAPDIGADEGNFIGLDMVGPAISFSAVPNSVCTSGTTLSAEITDASGVNVAAGTKPRLWFKKSTEDNVLPATNTSASSGWKWVEASNSSSPFEFTFDYTLLTSPATGGDIIEYFVVAQDLATPANVSGQVVVFDNCGVPTSVSLSSTLFPVTGTSSFDIIAVPGGIIASAAPDEVCIINDVVLSLSPAELGAEYQWESSPEGMNMWTPIPGANTATYTVAGVNASTDYRCVITCGGVPISASPSTVATVNVTNPQVLTTSPGEECGPGPVSVELGATASPGFFLSWYAESTGGVSIGSGPVFNTPLITETTTYYVAANDGGSSESAAKPTYTTTPNTSGNQWGLVFDIVNTEATIVSVEVYSVAAAGGTITVELKDNTGTLLESAGPFAIPPGDVSNPVPVTLPVNFTVPVGTGYRIVSAAMSGNLIRESSGNTYPYVSPSGNVVVTSGFITNPGSLTYYWFYNWQVSTGCESEREPVVATILNEVAECPADFTVCSSAGTFALSGASPAGGVYSGPGVSNGIFDPAVAGPGPHVITYTYCSTTCQFTITVGDPVASIDITETSGNADDDGVICAGDGVTLTASAAVSFAWSTGASMQSITVFPNTTTTYSVTVTDAFGCTASTEAQVIVNANPNASVTPANPTICDGDEVELTASGGISYAWSNDGNTASITVSPLQSESYIVTVTDANGCQDTASAFVTVAFPPTATEIITEPTTCNTSNGVINLTITGNGPYTFFWSTPNGSGIVQGQEDQNALSVGAYFVTITDANGCVSDYLYNLLGPGGCDVCPLIGNLTAPAQICSDTTFSLSATGLVNMGIEYGIEFKYSATPLDPYAGGTSLGIVPNANLINNGTEAFLSNLSLPAGSYQLYAILNPVPLDPTCRPVAIDSMTVNPIPAVNAVGNQVLCNGSATTAVNFSGSVPGTTYNWTNSNPSIGLAANGTGNIPSFTAINTGNAPAVATITVTPVFAGCIGASINFNITVNPTPTVNNPGAQVVCSGASVSIPFSGTVPGTVYSWTNSNTSIGLAASGSGNISFTATNNTGVGQVATITVTPSYTNGGVTCTGTPQVFTITVNPLPTMNQPANQLVCGGNLTAAVNFTSSAQGTTFAWTNNNTSIGLAANGVGNIPAFTAVNNSGVVQVATISVTPSFTSAGVTCAGAPVTFTITVDPPATVNAGADQTICQNQIASLSATLGGSATGGSWSGGAGVFANANALNTTYTPAASEYGSTITLTFTTSDPAGPCTAASDALNLTINTLPIVFAGGPEVNICPGQPLDLTSLGAFIEANGSGVTTGTWSTNGSGTFQPNNNFPGATSYVPSQADINAGFITITLTSADPAGPCGSVSDAFTLRFHTPEPMACNDLVQVSLEGSGVSEVTPDMILEGTYNLQFYSVMIFSGINAIGNTVDCDDIGKTFTVKVTDICFGNECWGTITVEDKWKPVVQCNTVEISCTQDYNSIPFPVATDNCTLFPNVEQTSQTIFDQDLCSENVVIITRTFIATDASGNESDECTQTIVINRPNNVDFPDDIEWECDVYDQYPNVVGATPLTGFLPTTGSGIPDGITGQYCMYDYTHSDQILAACGNTFKIVRTWTVLDWCTGTIITSNSQGEDNIQIIKVVDTTPPVITLAPYTVSANVAGAHPQPCASTSFLQAATITDNCNNWTVRIFTPVGEALYLNGTDGKQGGFIPFPGLSIGAHTIQYQAEDECGNIADLYVTVTVVDDIVPVAICDEITEVNLSSDGLAIMPASVLDDGSYDNCCLGYFEARRMDGDCDGNFDDFGPTVEFCCTDAGQAVTVIFRAYDCYGNFNDCMVTVNVNDKLPPIVLSCPQNQTINCDEYLLNYAAGLATGDFDVLAPFGTPTFYDNCELTITPNVTFNINTCQQGTITRSWQATDGVNAPVTCTQTITVTHLNNWEVLFPADITANCVNGQLPDFGEPQIFFDECELIAVSFDDQQFDVVVDACYKIVRTWTVINWCVYNPAANNTTADDILVSPRRYRSGPDGWVQYQQTIKVVDTDAPVFTVPAIDGCIVSTGCTKTLNLPYPDITDECSPTYTVNITGDFGTFNNIGQNGVNVPNVGVGVYEVTYAVTDNCGNTSYETVEIEVEDCKKPTPICKNGLIAEIMQTQMVEVFADQLNDGSFDNCGPVTFSFDPAQLITSIVFTCDDLGQQPVQVWVTDIYGNQDFCNTFVIVQNNMGACGGGVPVIVSGNIATEEDNDVAGVDVMINGGLFNQITGADGNFSFNLFAGGDYSVTPMLDANASNGVTTWDLVLISRHILNIQMLDSPYKIIAADANKSNGVTTLDMVHIRKVILQIEQGFPNNTSWRFVDKDFVFPNPANPFQTAFPEVINYNNLSADDLNADFVAVKVGDVNGSATTSFGGDVEERTFAGQMTIGVEDAQLKAGQTYTVAFTSEAIELLGYQFTLKYNAQALEIMDIVSGVASEENFGLLLEEGAITTSWNASEARAMSEGETLFSLVVRANADVTLSESFGISSNYTVAEAYNAGGQLLNVNLSFAGAQAEGFALFQNVPNPFQGATVIGFTLPEATTATLKVMDVSGKVLRYVQGDYSQGYNEVRLSDLPGSGVLYYQLETAMHSATKKMIILE